VLSVGTRRVQSKPAFSRFSPVHKVDLEGRLRVEAARSPRPPGRTAPCAKRSLRASASIAIRSLRGSVDDLVKAC